MSDDEAAPVRAVSREEAAMAANSGASASTRRVEATGGGMAFLDEAVRRACQRQRQLLSDAPVDPVQLALVARELDLSKPLARALLQQAPDHLARTVFLSHAGLV